MDNKTREDCPVGDRSDFGGISKKWGQLHTDGTGRQQIELQDLVLSIEEDVEGLLE